MIQLTEIKTTHENYTFMENLLETAFPLQERRNSDQQRKNTDENQLFHNTLITDDVLPIGLLTYWDFDTFVYIEHFAIDNSLRDRGYGSQALERFRQKINRPIVLEAEEPTDEITSRRIQFYQRQGFILQDIPYLQPPYRSKDEWFPLKLMTYGEINIKQNYILIRDTIYREVYEIKQGL